MVELSFSLLRWIAGVESSVVTVNSYLGLPQFCPCHPLGIPRLPLGCFDQSSTTMLPVWAPVREAASTIAPTRRHDVSSHRAGEPARTVAFDDSCAAGRSGFCVLPGFMERGGIETP